MSHMSEAHAELHNLRPDPLTQAQEQTSHFRECVRYAVERGYKWMIYNRVYYFIRDGQAVRA